MVKIAGIQIYCSEDKARNIEKAVRFTQIAIDKGAQIICYPELFSTHWFPKDMDKNNFSYAERIDGPTISKMKEIAKKFDVVLICPIFEKDEENYYNSAIIIDAGGEILGSYRKIHIPQIPLWEEKFYFSPGNNGFPVFKTKYASIGVQICWDNFFPEGTRILALKGAQIVFSPTAAAFASQRRWEAVISSNAIFNGIYIFRVNRVGSEEKQDFYGKSFCISPEGDFVDEPTGMKEGIALIDVNLRTIDQVRREFPFLKDRKPDLYFEILKY